MNTWKNVEDGIEFVLHFEHGDADAHTIEKVHINLNESEKNLLGRILKLMENNSFYDYKYECIKLKNKIIIINNIVYLN